MTKVSIIVPVYNVEAYLTKCLDSLVNQSLKDIEIIVVNDGSPDNSQKIINKYTQKYACVKGYIKENGGLSDARNYGLKKAHGEYILFVDSDDYIERQMVEKMYHHAIKNKLDVVVCDTINVYPDGHEQVIKSNVDYADNNLENYLISPPMACIRLFKKDIFNKLAFKKGIFYEDLELTPKVVNITKKVGFLDEPLYYYLQRSGSIMKQKAFNDHLLDIFDVLKSNKEALAKTYPLAIEYMYITHLLRTATLRFLEYDHNKQYIQRIVKEIKDNYPNWQKNPYYQKSSMKLKLICLLAYHKQLKVLKIIKKITKK